VDRLSGFTSGGPIILLDRSIFTEAEFNVDGILLQNNFRIGGNAINENQHIIYNQNRGEIFYDPDGNGPLDKILFATVNPMTQVFHINFSDYVL
jgi:Ca2+-binding RTX toxin-like protein